GDLAHRPAFVLALYMDDVARLPQIAGAARGAGLGDAPDPLALARETQGSGAVLLHARNVPDPHPRAVLEDLEHHAQMPAIYVARRIDIGQSLAPALGLAGGDLLDAGDRAAIVPAAPVILLQLVAQHALGDLLKLRVDGGADRQAAMVELLDTDLRHQLPANLVREVVRPGVAQDGRRVLAEDRVE